MDPNTARFFEGWALLVVALLFALQSEKFVGVKLSRFWFVVSIPLALFGIHLLAPHFFPDLINKVRAGTG